MATTVTFRQRDETKGSSSNKKEVIKHFQVAVITDVVAMSESPARTPTTTITIVITNSRLLMKYYWGQLLL